MKRKFAFRLLWGLVMGSLLLVGFVVPVQAGVVTDDVSPPDFSLSPSVQTIEVGQDFALKALVSNSTPMTITGVKLEIEAAPSGVVTPTSWWFAWSEIASGALVSHSITGRALLASDDGVLITALLSYSDTVQKLERQVTVRVEPGDVPLALTPLNTPPAPTPTPTPLPTPVSSALLETPTLVPSKDRSESRLGFALWMLLFIVVIMLAVALATFYVLRTLLIRPPEPPNSPEPALSPPPYLEIEGVDAEPFYLTTSEVTIGRAPDNVLVITDEMPGWETVSRYHARLHKPGAHWILEDVNSRNGVYVNGQRTGRNLLRDGWQMGIGAVTIIFHVNKTEAQDDRVP